ncbi:MAG: hypothetical protein DRO93_08740 [Candidatus Thorarchaeota archaeon]|nr:MAG: hypothetical protein DRO93_08740 [Candidatus Thorarchaeota archaeon]
MSLHDRIPEPLKLTDAVVAITMEDEVEVFPTSDYVLVEISPTAGRINVGKIAATVHNLVKNDKRMVAIRGYGFKGVGLSVRIAHEIKKRERRFIYQMAFDTFDAEDSEGKPYTSIQVVIMPPEDDSSEDG